MKLGEGRQTSAAEEQDLTPVSSLLHKHSKQHGSIIAHYVDLLMRAEESKT